MFVYNGFGRVDQASPNQLLTRAIGLRFGSPAPGWDRLLTGGVGHDTAWLIPAALIALVGCLVAGRGRDGRRLRVSVALWGTWLIVLLVVFSAVLHHQPVLHGRTVATDRRAARHRRGAGLGASLRLPGPAGGRGHGRGERRLRRVAAARPGSGARGRAARSRDRARARRDIAPGDRRPPVAKRRSRAGRGRDHRRPRGRLSLGREQRLRAVRHAVRVGRGLWLCPHPGAGRGADRGSAPAAGARQSDPAGSAGDPDRPPSPPRSSTTVGRRSCRSAGSPARSRSRRFRA